jgi:glutamine synthetase
MTLGEALDKLDKDKLIQGALPGDMLRVFTEYKRDEWEEFLATPTQWDLDKYLDCLP